MGREGEHKRGKVRGRVRERGGREKDGKMERGGRERGKERGIV